MGHHRVHLVEASQYVDQSEDLPKASSYYMQVVLSDDQQPIATAITIMVIIIINPYPSIQLVNSFIKEMVLGVTGHHSLHHRCIILHLVILRWISDTMELKE